MAELKGKRLVLGVTGGIAAYKAAELARLPQACLRHDRLSSYEQWGQPLPQAMANEFTHGLKTLESGEWLQGAARFGKGEGKHGAF